MLKKSPLNTGFIEYFSIPENRLYLGKNGGQKSTFLKKNLIHPHPILFTNVSFYYRLTCTNIHILLSEQNHIILVVHDKRVGSLSSQFFQPLLQRSEDEEKNYIVTGEETWAST